MGKLFKRLFGLVGALVVVAGLAVGGYYIYKNFIQKNVGPFEIIYKYEQQIEGYGDKVVIVSGYKGVSPETIIIPDTYNIEGADRPVKSIKSRAFENNKNVKTIETPESCMTFGMYAFAGCTSLETITIHASYIYGFVFVLGEIDASNVTINVVNTDVENAVKTDYPKANVVVLS